MFTWYVNTNMDVQVYEGFISEYFIYDFKNADEAREHKVSWVDTPSAYERCKYYIPKDKAEAFFTCIGEMTCQLMFSYGVTDVNVSDFLG